MTIKTPNVAGMFYPGEARVLRDMIADYLSAAPLREGMRARGLIAPHAGYIYSGPVAAYGYKQLTMLPDREWKVIVMAPSHFAYFPGVAVGDFSGYQTPLGVVEVDTGSVKTLLANPLFQVVPEAFAQEHALEVQLPFLQTVLKRFKLIPLVFGEADSREAAESLNKIINDDTLVVASSDLSHYHPYKEAKALDQACVQVVLKSDIGLMAGEEACGKGPILTLMHIARMRGWKFKLMDYRNSGDTAGDKDAVVGYASIIAV
jgi:hypothetical protein